MRGIELVFPQHCNVKLDQLLLNIPLLGHKFVIDDGIVYQKNSKIILQQVVDFSYIQRISKNDIFILSLVLQSYPRDAQIVNIDVYKDFKESRCDLLLLICDGSYVEIYCKDKSWLVQCIENAEMLGATEISIKTDISDQRTGMYV